MKPLTIGEVASRAGIGVETIRFYERKGLLSEPARTRSGYRQYREEDIARLEFIQRAKGLGFTLKEIKELLSLRAEPAGACAEMQSRAEAKISDIKAKLQDLQRIKESLLKLVAACQGHGETRPCPILDALDRR